MSCKFFWTPLKNSLLYLCFYFVSGVVGSFWFRLGCWSFLHLLWTSPSWEYYNFVWGMIHSKKPTFEKAASPPIDDPDDPVYACSFFMPYIYFNCVYIFSVYTLLAITVIHKKNLLHYSSNLSTSSVWLVMVSGSRNSKTADLEMADCGVYLCGWGFSHTTLDYLYYGPRRGCCVLHVWRWQILTGSELEAIGSSVVGGRTLKETCLFFPPPTTQGSWSQDSDDIQGLVILLGGWNSVGWRRG